MERIQFAIAKARAERDARDGMEPPPKMGLPSLMKGIAAARDAVATPSPIETDAHSEDGTAAAWRDLATLAVNKRHALRHRLVSLVGGAGATEMDGIRTRLLQHMAANGLRRIAITSPTPACGKSTVAINLGFSLGRLNEHRTIVADLDLRRPTMHKALKIKTRHSFANVLSGESDFAANALRHGQTLAFASTHETIRHPAELLQSRKTAQKLAEIEARYAPTVMIFDLPPLLVNDDALAFLGHVDAALIVAAGERTTIKEVDRAEREVASQTKVLGVILNSCRYMDGTDGYAAYYN